MPGFPALAAVLAMMGTVFGGVIYLVRLGEKKQVAKDSATVKKDAQAAVSASQGILEANQNTTIDTVRQSLQDGTF